MNGHVLLMLILLFIFLSTVARCDLEHAARSESPAPGENAARSKPAASQVEAER